MAGNVVKKIDEKVPVRHALVSVSDKTGLDNLAPSLLELCPELRIMSTGGTFNSIQNIIGNRKGNNPLIQVSDYTGQPETQGGLVKTLDWKIYLGLLTETHNPSHQDDLKRAEAVPIDLVVVNLYPFAQTIVKSCVTPEEARANIDIGGPCMIRAAAKNFHRVLVVVDPTDYPAVLEELRSNNGKTTLKFRFRMMRKAFQITGAYDRAIATYLKETSLSDVATCYRIENQ